MILIIYDDIKLSTFILRDFDRELENHFFVGERAIYFSESVKFGLNIDQILGVQ